VRDYIVNKVICLRYHLGVIGKKIGKMDIDRSISQDIALARINQEEG
jgi:hypothetical protein